MYAGYVHVSASGPQRLEGNGCEPSDMVLETKLESSERAVHAFNH